MLNYYIYIYYNHNVSINYFSVIYGSKTPAQVALNNKLYISINNYMILDELTNITKREYFLLLKLNFIAVRKPNILLWGIEHTAFEIDQLSGVFLRLF